MNINDVVSQMRSATVKQSVGALLAVLMLSVTSGSLADSKNPAHSAVSFSKTIKGLEQPQQRLDGALVAKGTISGTGKVNASHVIIKGVVSPGNSPGCIEFNGDVTFSPSGTLLSEIGGLTPCEEYDQITVDGALDINNATLEVVLINSFVPAVGDRFDILNWGSLTGSFGNIDISGATLPAPLVWDTSQLYVSGELVVNVQSIADGDLAPWNNPDGQINAADVLIAQQLVLQQRLPGALQYAHGDMNTDGKIDVADLILITQAAANQSP
jgi:hypothetical protein